ncbi:MAG: hypothetical protein OEZ47_16650, partial [Gammaproteobacteria bacterium]|nr:hypothetical protein [Gammaproteobacteria bacterium]
SEKTLKNVGRPWPMAKQRFFEVMTIPHPGMMHHRSLFSEVGNFDETFKIAGDYDLLLRYLCSHDAIYIPSVNVACMTYGGISTSSNNVRLKYKEVIKAREKIGLRKKTMFMRFYWSRATVRAILEELLGRKVTNTLADACRLLVGRKRVWTRT